MKKRRAYAVQRLRSAFADASVPDVRRLVGTVALTTWPSIESVRARFEGKLWYRIPPEDYDPYEPLICYLSPDAHRYYLPGLVLQAVETADIDLIWNALSSIGLTSSFGDVERAEKRIGVYERDQVRALASAVRAMASMGRKHGGPMLWDECMETYRELRRHSVEIAL